MLSIIAAGAAAYVSLKVKADLASFEVKFIKDLDNRYVRMQESNIRADLLAKEEMAYRQNRKEEVQSYRSDRKEETSEMHSDIKHVRESLERIEKKLDKNGYKEAK